MRKIIKSITWRFANLVSKWHVWVDGITKSCITLAEEAKSENLRLWASRLARILTYYNSLNNKENDDE